MASTTCGCVSTTAGGMATWSGTSPLLSSRLAMNGLGSEWRITQVPAAAGLSCSRRAIGARAVLGMDSAVEKETKRINSAKENLAKIFKEKPVEVVLEQLEGAAAMLKSAVGVAKTEVLNVIVDLAFKPSDEENVYFQGNFGPVPEVSGKTTVKVISGELPKDFPAGTFIRNGPNPQFGGKLTESAFGGLLFHWFEGDGMLHAMYFDGEGSVPKYMNRFVGTHGYKLEKERGKPMYLNTVEGNSKAVTLGYLFNQLRFGLANKTTCNTAIFEIGGKMYANAEGPLPHEINVSDLSTGGVYDVNGGWDRPFTSHPKEGMVPLPADYALNPGHTFLCARINKKY